MAEGNMKDNKTVIHSETKQKNIPVKVKEPSHDKYEGLKEELANKLRSCEMQYFMQDKPIPFKGMYLYPITMRDYDVFFMCTACLTLNKRDAGVAGLKMTHLDYLVSKMQLPGDEGASWSFRAQKLFELVFHIQNGLKCQGKDCNHVISYDSPEFAKFMTEIRALASLKPEEITKETKRPELICPKCGGKDFQEMIKVRKNPDNPKHYQLLINGQIIDARDFEFLRSVLLYQNIPDYRDDSWVDPDMKKDYEEKMRIETQKRGGSAHATTEEKIVALSVTSSYRLEDIYNMSIRKFSIALKTVENLIEYKITKTAMMSGLIDSSKMKLDHWLYKKDKDMYGDSYKTVDQAQAEVSRTVS